MTFPVLDTGPAFHVAFHWSDGAQTAITTMSFQVDDSGSAADLAEALDANWTANMTGDCADGSKVREFHITPYDGDSSPVPFTSASGKWQGGTGGSWVPSVAEVVSFSTGSGDRRKRGRMFLPFITESSIANGFVTSGSDTTGTTAWNAFLLAMAADGFTPIVASTITHRTDTTHNVDGSVTRGIPIGGALLPTGTVIERATFRQKLGTQRRRQSRV